MTTRTRLQRLDAISAIQSMSTPWKATAIVSCLVCVAMLCA
jgi:hypothetical protein